MIMRQNPLTGETLPAGSNLSDGARLAISCRNLWSPLAKALIDVRIFNPQAESNWNKSVQQMYNSHEEEKKNSRGRSVERTSVEPRGYWFRPGGLDAEKSLLSHASGIQVLGP